MTRHEEGAELEDAVLAEMHRILRSNRKVGDEFAAYFMLRMMKMGSKTLPSSSGLRRYLDTGDLVDSVFGDIWGKLAGLKFETRGQFHELFQQRMDWKVKDKVRGFRSRSRAEDLRVPMPDEQELESVGMEEAQPVGHSIKREQRERYILILLRMKEREARILSLHLKGASIEDIATALDLTYEAARKALSRAIDSARRLAGG